MINEQTPSRTYNTITNSLFGVGASIITVALNFLVRVFLVRELGAEINGLHNLFQSVTNVVALMEMGFSSAMIMHLYKPIKGDYPRFCVKFQQVQNEAFEIWVRCCFQLRAFLIIPNNRRRA